MSEQQNSTGPQPGWDIGSPPTNPAPQPIDGRKRSPRMVPFEGCPTFSADDVPEVPDGATIRVRILIRWDGEEVAFERKPFPIGITLPDIQKRWGPATYVLQLWTVNPESPGSGLTKQLKQRTVEVRSRGDLDVGDECWPINRSSSDIPRGLLEEMDRRDGVRGDSVADVGMPGMPGMPMNAPGNNPYQSYSTGPNADAVTGQVVTAGGPPAEAPPGFAWTWQNPAGWVLVHQPGAMAQNQGGGGLVGSLVTLLSKPADELLLLAGGAVKLWQAISPAAQQPAQQMQVQPNLVEIERIKQEGETKRAELAQQNALLLEQMRFETAKLTAAAQQNAAPPVDPDAIRAKVMAEVQGRELNDIKAELRAARENGNKKLDLAGEMQRFAQTATLFGFSKHAAAGAKVTPTLLEQFADLLDTNAGAAAVKMFLSKALEVPIPPDAPALPAEPPAGSIGSGG